MNLNYLIILCLPMLVSGLTCLILILEFYLQIRLNSKLIYFLNLIVTFNSTLLALKLFYFYYILNYTYILNLKYNTWFSFFSEFKYNSNLNFFQIHFMLKHLFYNDIKPLKYDLEMLVSEYLSKNMMIPNKVI